MSSNEKYTDNPFKEGVVIIPKRVRMSGVDEDKIVRDNKTGIESTLKFSYNVIREESSFVKVYKDSIKQIFDLSNPATKVFWFCCMNLRPNNDVIDLNKDEFMSWSGYTNRKSFYDGINELLEKKIIARSEREGWFFVNHAVFFTGNRLRVETTYYKS